MARKLIDTGEASWSEPVSVTTDDGRLIARYGTLETEELGLRQSAKLLNATLQEENLTGKRRRRMRP